MNCKAQLPVTNATRPTRPPQNKPKARTFNMTIKDAVQNSNVVADTLLVNSLNAKVLIDSGATKYFISKDFLISCNIKFIR